MTVPSPWLVSHRLGVLGSQGQVGEAPLMVQQLPLGWESQGYKSLMGKGRSLLGGKPRRPLGCAATADEAKQLSSLYSCIRGQGHPIPSFSNMDVERTNTMCELLR